MPSTAMGESLTTVATAPTQLVPETAFSEVAAVVTNTDVLFVADTAETVTVAWFVACAAAEIPHIPLRATSFVNW